MKRIKYSVIIPAYNAEKTLRRCLDCVLRQDRADVQILLISDGSTDGTDAIAASYGDDIVFLRQRHAGVSAARNRGLYLAAGEYVTFVDSDDYVTADYFAALDREPDCDFLTFGAGDCAGGDVLRNLLATRKLMSPCNKRLRRTFLLENQIRFPEGMQIGEDLCFCFACALAAKSLAVSPADLYRVDVSNPNSLSRGYRPGLDREMVRVFDNIRKLEGAARYGDLLDALYVRNAFTCIAEEYKRGRPTRQRVEEICQVFRAPIGPVVGWMHRWVRRMLTGSCLPIWFAAWLLKGRTWEQHRRKKY